MFNLDTIQRGIYTSLANQVGVPVYFYPQTNKAETYVKITQLKILEGSSLGSGIAEVEVKLQIISTLKSSANVLHVTEIISSLYHDNKIKFDGLIVNCNGNLERVFNINTEHKWSGEITFDFCLEPIN